MKDINNNVTYRGCLLMMQDRWGLWHFMHYPERKPLTNDELNLLQQTSTNGWIEISYPSQPLTEAEHNALKVNQYGRQ